MTRTQNNSSNILDVETSGFTVREWLAFDAWRVQRVVRLIFEPPLKLLWRYKWIGTENIPAEGPLLMCPNHTHTFDFIPQAMGHRKPFRVMGKYEILRYPVAGRILREGGVFPVVRGASDSTAMNLANLVLEDGQMLIIYPEGTRCRTRGGGIGKPRRGAARLALATGCSILPVATFGMQPGTGRTHLPKWLRWLPFQRRVITVYGKPFSVEREDNPSVDRVNEVCEEIWRHVTDTYSEARRYATGEST